jgi:hypothetical protein
MKKSYTIGKHKVATIFYLNECKLYCTFEREHTPNNDLVALMITYDDFAREDSDKWEINEHHYDLNGNFTYLKKEEYLTWDEVCNKKGEYFSAEISNVLVTLLYNGHEITIFNGNAIASFVYSKDLFNALMLKKVE